MRPCKHTTYGFQCNRAQNQKYSAHIIYRDRHTHNTLNGTWIGGKLGKRFLATNSKSTKQYLFTWTFERSMAATNYITCCVSNMTCARFYARMLEISERQQLPSDNFFFNTVSFDQIWLINHPIHAHCCRPRGWWISGRRKISRWEWLRQRGKTLQKYIILRTRFYEHLKMNKIKQKLGSFWTQ